MARTILSLLFFFLYSLTYSKGDATIEDTSCTKTETLATTVKEEDISVSEKAEIIFGEATLVGQKITRGGSSHFEFKGIPYAKPPVGELRFKAPLPVGKLEGTFDATIFGSKCLQSDFFDEGKAKGSEDCLFLNIYSPWGELRLPGLPVLFWIHGGGFTLGAGEDYNPQPLMGEDVIVVTVNYRLSGFGFMSFDNEKVSGNMGLEDTALAIDWVRENIAQFGGDPERITIFGESAGGMAVHANVLSPRNKDKLAGAIAMSGTMISFGIHNPNDDGLKAKILSEALNCSPSLDQETLDCLQEKDSHELLDTMSRLMMDISSEGGVWKPNVDSFIPDPFLPLPPLEAMVRGQFNKIPFISGTIKNDGWFMARMFGQVLDFSDDESFARALLLKPDGKKPTDPKTDKEAHSVARIMRKIAESEENGWNKIINDAVFFVPDQITVESMVQHNPNVFNYVFTQKNDWSPLGLSFNFTEDEGPHHGDELQFLFRVKAFPGFEDPVFIEEEQKLGRDMVQLWTNFAKFGHPTPPGDSVQNLPMWNQVTLLSGGYMNISSSSNMELHHASPDRTLLWKKMVYGPAIEKIERQMLYEKCI